MFLCSVIQALGCILYLLCFKQHPFEEGAKLQIVNGKYSIPQNDAKYNVYHDLIRTFYQTIYRSQTLLKQCVNKQLIKIFKTVKSRKIVCLLLLNKKKPQRLK